MPSLLVSNLLRLIVFTAVIIVASCKNPNKLDDFTEIQILAQCEAVCYRNQLFERGNNYTDISDIINCQLETCVECISPTRSALIDDVNRCENKCKNSSACISSCHCINDALNFYQNNGTISKSNAPVTTTAPKFGCHELPNKSKYAYGKFPTYQDYMVMKLSVGLKDQVKNLSSPTADKLIVYVVEMRNRYRLQWTTLGKIAFPCLVVENLTVDTEYQFRVTAMAPDGAIHPPKRVSEWIKTLSADTVLSPPTNLTAVESMVENGKVAVQFTWTPPKERFCHYKVFYYSNNDTTARAVNVMLAVDQNRFKLDQLSYSSNYTIFMVSTTNTSYPESRKASKWIITKSCLELNNYNFSICSPGPVQNMSLSLEDVDDKAAVSVTWHPPRHTSINHFNRIEEYSISLRNDLLKNPFTRYFMRRQIILGNETSYVFSDVPSGNYIIGVIAVSKGGNGQEHRLKLTVPSTSQESDDYSFFSIVLYLLFAAGVVIVIALSVIGYYSNKNIKLQSHKRMITSNFLEMWTRNRLLSSEKEVTKTKLLDEDHNEINFKDIQFGPIIGDGEYGVVKKGFVKSKQVPSSWETVAIKLAKGGYESERLLFDEINTMKAVGFHPHIVQVIGYCTVSPNICLLVEFCPLGDLRSYLQKMHEKRKKVIQHLDSSLFSGHIDYIDTFRSKTDISIYEPSPNNAVNYKVSAVNNPAHSHLLSFARQIAMAMEYLSQNKFIHRDLAARNVLVFTSKTVKLSDFGLSKDVYERNYYKLKSNTRLPVKWMAKESILHQQFTTQSDVWSYGVLLWEIVTMGGTPYPGINNAEMYNYLENGHRMEAPANCSKEMYDMMLTCWQDNPLTRPTFTELRKTLEFMLEQFMDYLTLDTDYNENYYVTSNATD